MLTNRLGRPRSCTNASGGQRDRAEGGDLGRPRETRPVGALAARRQQGRGAGEAAEEEVAGDVPGFPGRRLQDRPAVVAVEVGRRHDQLLASSATVSTATTAGRCGGHRLGRRTKLANARAARVRAAAPALPPHRTEVAGRDDRVRRQAVDLGLVEEQEERAVTADPVGGVRAVQARTGLATFVELLDPGRCALPELVEVAVLDRLGRAGGGARRFEATAEPVVAHRALPDPAVVLALVDHAVRTGGNAVATTVADVLLDDDGAELGPDQRPGRTYVETGRVGAVLAHV